MSTKRWIVWSLFAAVSLLAALPSGACPVCFGETDAPIVKGLEYSVLFMIGVTYFLLVGGVATFFLLRRRARRLNEISAESA